MQENTEIVNPQITDSVTSHVTDSDTQSVKKRVGRPRKIDGSGNVPKQKVKSDGPRKTDLKFPASSFTLKELMLANPNVKYNTLYQRLKVLEEKGDLWSNATLKNKPGKGRAENVYSVPTGDSVEHSHLQLAREQGRLKQVEVGV